MWEVLSSILSIMGKEGEEGRVVNLSRSYHPAPKS